MTSELTAVHSLLLVLIIFDSELKPKVEEVHGKQTPYPTGSELSQECKRLFLGSWISLGRCGNLNTRMSPARPSRRPLTLVLALASVHIEPLVLHYILQPPNAQTSRVHRQDGNYEPVPAY